MSDRDCGPPSWYPTATVGPCAVPATPVRKLPDVPGVGLDTSVHALPSQCSITVFGPGDPVTEPTAQMSLADRADTPVSVVASSGSRDAAGAGTIRQTCPSQCSTRWPWPTAQMSFADSAVTAVSPHSSGRGDGSGTGTTLQTCPFQCSTRGAVPPGATSVEPTAQASVDDSALTPARKPGLGRAGVATWRQARPSKCATSGARAGFTTAPTAQMSRGARACTAANRPGVRASPATLTARQPLWVLRATSGRGELSGRMLAPTAQKLVGDAAVTPKSTALPPGFGLATTCHAAGAGAGRGAGEARAAGTTAAARTSAAPASIIRVVVCMGAPFPGVGAIPPPGRTYEATLSTVNIAFRSAAG